MPLSVEIPILDAATDFFRAWEKMPLSALLPL
jgi:hypothetical protein